MSPSDSSNHPDDRERDRDRDPERGDRGDRAGSRQKPAASAASKSKDLSHVPCKFYKVGGCTAGSSCPFSHSMAEPGGQKETCAWFVKGNCKFGHKCALAHILPGQSMAMDRKNKKAAQVAAAAANGGERGDRSERGGKDGKGGRGGNPKREGHASSGAGPGAGNPGNRNPLLAGGSTAPTRILGPPASTPAGRPPMTMPLKATLSPSAPAPPLASFGVLDDLEGAGVQLASAPAQGKRASTEVTLNPSDTTPTQELEAQLKPNATSSPGPLPPSAPRPTATSVKTQPDFGPIGSPPTSGSHTSPSRLNRNGAAFNPGSSPQHINGISVVPGSPTQNADNNFLSTSPFSAPGTQSVFLSGGGSYNGAGGMAASLGSGLAMMGGRKGWGSGESGSVGTGGGGFAGMVPSSVQQRMNGGRGEYDIGFEYEEHGRRSGLGIGRGSGLRGGDIVVEDEDLEDFLPSSLTDLLTPEERSRRMSRSNSGQGPATALGGGFGGGELNSRAPGSEAGTGGGLGMGHRYSRSVPAPSLLGDIKSIWADTSAHPMPSSPPTHRGTPSSSFTSRFDQGLGMSHASGDETGLSMSMGSAGGGMMGMSPSNASAAFLPGLHSHYLSAKAKQAQAAQLGLGAVGRGVRGTSGPLYGATGTNNSTLTNNYLLGGSGLSPSANNIHTHTHNSAQHSYRAAPSPFDLTQQQHHHLLAPQPHTSRPIPSNGNTTNNSNTNDDPHQGTHLLSPSSRALQSHAPGQSLPQGLAAGYSRIHALPPPPSLASPGSASIFGNGTPPGLEGAGIPGSGPYGGWASAASPPSGNASGLDSMFSRLSYSAAAAARATPTQSNTNPNIPTTTNNMSPPGLQRNVSGGRYPQQAQGPLSPLNGPVVTRDDDDDLFSMDG